MVAMLNPETITVLDPACGSGHILVVAYRGQNRRRCHAEPTSNSHFGS